LPVVFRLMARVAHVMERSEPTQGRATPCRGAATDDRERCRLGRALSWDGRSGRICRWTARTASGALSTSSVAVGRQRRGRD